MFLDELAEKSGHTTKTVIRRLQEGGMLHDKSDDANPGNQTVNPSAKKAIESRNGEPWIDGRTKLARGIKGM